MLLYMADTLPTFIMTFTAKDIRQVRKGWFTITVVDFMTALESKYRSTREDGKVQTELHVDLSVSPLDKRDWFLTTRNGITLENDGSAIKEVFAKRYNTIAEMKQALVDLANKLAEENN